MSLKGLFIIGKHEKTINKQNPNPKRCNTKSQWAPLGLVGQPTSRGHNLVILSPFGVHDTFLERSLRVIQCLKHASTYDKGPAAGLEKHFLQDQNYSGSSGPEKQLKIVNVAINKEIDETDWNSMSNRQVDTNIHLDQPLENIIHKRICRLVVKSRTIK